MRFFCAVAGRFNGLHGQICTVPTLTDLEHGQFRLTDHTNWFICFSICFCAIAHSVFEKLHVVERCFSCYAFLRQANLKSYENLL